MSSEEWCVIKRTGNPFSAAEIANIAEVIVDTRKMIVERLKENGCRITKQRLMLIDIILDNECQSCKEIYYKAVQADKRIGVATVYRMVNALEEIGAISRKNMYKVECAEGCEEECSGEETCIVVLDDNTTYHLTSGKWCRIMAEGLKSCGYLKNQKIASIKIEK